VAAEPLRGRGRGAGEGARGRRGGHRGRRRQARRHDAERHHQGIPVPGNPRVPAGAEPAVDRRHDRLHRLAHAEVEPRQHLQLSPAGGGRDAGAGGRVRHGDRDPGAGRGARLRTGVAGEVRRRRRPDQFLRQRRRAVRRRDVQDARVRAAVGRTHGGAVRRRRPEAPAVPLRRTGQLVGPHREPAREQRPAHRVGDARRHAVQGRAGPRGPAPCVERGPRPAPALGPAVEPAAAAGVGVRVRPAGIRGHLRRQLGHRGQGRRDRRGRQGRDGQDRGDGRRGRGRRERLHEAGAGRQPRAAAPAHRVRRGHRGGHQQVHDHRAEPAHGRPRHRDPDRGPEGGGGGRRGREEVARRSGTPTPRPRRTPRRRWPR
jgi:hypothetical protein